MSSLGRGYHCSLAVPAGYASAWAASESSLHEQFPFGQYKLPALVQILIWSRITPSPIKVESQIGFKSCRLETAFFMKLLDEGSYTFATFPSPPPAPHCRAQQLSISTLPFWSEGYGEAGGGLPVAACAAVKLRAGLGSSAAATKKPPLGLCRGLTPAGS